MPVAIYNGIVQPFTDENKFCEKIAQKPFFLNSFRGQISNASPALPLRPFPLSSGFARNPVKNAQNLH
jgi:hypothetical protein